MGYKVEKIIDAPIRKVWKSWSSENETKKWLAPKARVIFEENGAYEFFWDEDPNIDSTIGCKIKTIENGRRITFEWQGKTEYIGMFREPYGPTMIEVRFVEEENGKTKLILEQKETRELEKWKDYDEWMYGAWEYAIDCLKKYIEKNK